MRLFVQAHESDPAGGLLPMFSTSLAGWKEEAEILQQEATCLEGLVGRVGFEGSGLGCAGTGRKEGRKEP